MTTEEHRLLSKIVGRMLDNKRYKLVDAELATARALEKRGFIKPVADDRWAQPANRGLRALGNWKGEDASAQEGDDRVGQSDAFWERPGGRLLRKLLPAWRAANPEGAVDDLLERELPRVVDVLGAWIHKKKRKGNRLLQRASVLFANGYKASQPNKSSRREAEELLYEVAKIPASVWPYGALEREARKHKIVLTSPAGVPIFEGLKLRRSAPDFGVEFFEVGKQPASDETTIAVRPAGSAQWRRVKLSELDAAIDKTSFGRKWWEGPAGGSTWTWPEDDAEKMVAEARSLARTHGMEVLKRHFDGASDDFRKTVWSSIRDGLVSAPTGLLPVEDAVRELQLVESFTEGAEGAELLAWTPSGFDRFIQLAMQSDHKVEDLVKVSRQWWDKAFPRARLLARDESEHDSVFILGPEHPLAGDLDARVLEVLTSGPRANVHEIKLATGEADVFEVRRSLHRLITQRAVRWTAGDGYAPLEKGATPGYVGISASTERLRGEFERRVVIALGAHPEGVTISDLWVGLPGSRNFLRNSLNRLAALWKKSEEGTIRYFPELPKFRWSSTSHNKGFSVGWAGGTFKIVETTPGCFALYFLRDDEEGREEPPEGAVESYGCGSRDEVEALAQQLAAANMPNAAEWRHYGGHFRKCPPEPKSPRRWFAEDSMRVK